MHSYHPLGLGNITLALSVRSDVRGVAPHSQYNICAEGYTAEHYQLSLAKGCKP